MRKSMVFVLFHLALTVSYLAADTTTADVYAFKAKTIVDKPTGTDVATLLQQTESTRVIDTTLTTLSKVPSIKRWQGATRGDVVRVYSFHHTSDNKPRHATIKADEVARSLHIVEQLGDLIKVAEALRQGGTQGAEAADKERIAVSHTDFVLKEVRATLTVTGQVEAGAGTPGNEEKNAATWIVLLDFTGGGKATDADSASITIITGPREPWSISANVPLQKSSDVKLTDDRTGIALTADKPSAFYVGLDYTWGDVLSTPRTFGEAVELKVLLKASRAPLDSYGAALALRGGFWSEMFPKTNVLHIFDSITPFVGYAHTRVTATSKDAAGNATTVKGHSNGAVVGLSFDIKKAVDWVQKPAAKDDTAKK